MRSGELARLAGVSVRALRHYHAIGLLPEPNRSSNGYRDYDAGDLLRVLRIRQLASLGFSLEQAGPMLDELDAARERALAEGLPGAGASPAQGHAACAGEDLSPCESLDAAPSSADALLDNLDAALAEQIERLQEQRRVVARLRSNHLAADVPARASGVLDALMRLEGEAGGAGILDGALAAGDRLGLGIAAHLYSDGELAEVERVFRAIPERGLVDAYRAASELVSSLPAHASQTERDAAYEASLRLLEELEDCFDAENWLRPDTDCERILDEVATGDFNPAQLEVSERIFCGLVERLRARERHGA